MQSMLICVLNLVIFTDDTTYPINFQGINVLFICYIYLSCILLEFIIDT
jgi:hypothetical protein